MGSPEMDFEEQVRLPHVARNSKNQVQSQGPANQVPKSTPHQRLNISSEIFMSPTSPGGYIMERSSVINSDDDDGKENGDDNDSWSDSSTPKLLKHLSDRVWTKEEDERLKYYRQLFPQHKNIVRGLNNEGIKVTEDQVRQRLDVVVKRRKGRRKF
jgi:hypothetical protein